LRLEGRLRLALLDKLPRLDDRYLRSRPSSDMAGRGHALHVLRDLPALWAQLVRSVLALVFTTGALVWLHPEGRLLAPALALAALAVPLLGRRSLSEISSRLRTHTSALDRFYLDALLGINPIRVHGAERAVRAEHEELLTHWSHCARLLQGRRTRLQALQLSSSTVVAVALVLSYVAQQREVAGLLSFAYWALGVPASAAELGTSLQVLRNLRGITLRLCSPLAAPSVADPARHEPEGTHPTAGVELRFGGASVHAGGHQLLAPTDLLIPAGAHVAIVGASGAGKSTLLSVLLRLAAPERGAGERRRPRADGGAAGHAARTNRLDRSSGAAMGAFPLRQRDVRR
jgi:ATP-binding cassette subfamily B protein